MQLGTFIASHDLTLAEFGESVTVSAVTVHRWVKRKAIPSRANMSRIREVTNGQVSPGDFFEDCSGSEPMLHARAA